VEISVFLNRQAQSTSCLDFYFLNNKTGTEVNTIATQYWGNTEQINCGARRKRLGKSQNYVKRCSNFIAELKRVHVASLIELLWCI